MKWTLKKFEELTSREVYEILKLRIEIFIVEQNCLYQELDDKDYKSYHLFAEDQNRVVAYCRLVKPGVSYKEPSVGRVVVDKAYRKTGLGRELFTLALKELEEKFNSNECRISAQAYLLNFYSSLGFQKVSDEYLEDFLPHIEMYYTAQGN